MRLSLIIVTVAALSLVGQACSSDDTGVDMEGQSVGAGGGSGSGLDVTTPNVGADVTPDASRPPLRGGDTTGPSADGGAAAGDAASPAGDGAVVQPGADGTVEPSEDATLAADGGTDPESSDAGPTDPGTADGGAGGDGVAVGCEADEVENCEGGCTNAGWIADDFCDTVLDCEALDFDGGDCVPECGDGKCNGEETYETCGEDCPAPVVSDNHPCAAADGPGSSDEDVTACVCAQDAWCCTNSWDNFCIQLAQEPCGALCDCSEVACEADADCGGCYGDACIGTWSCTDGLCVQGEGVVCETPEGAGCIASQCDSATGACVDTAVDDLCDDGSACTLDSCDGETGECTYAPSDQCGDQHPCVPSEMPGSGDPDVQACLCAADAYCCTTQWDFVCVAGAIESCGLVCDCMEASAEALACEADTDCAWCGDGACTGAFVCQDGTCQATAPVVCDTADDTDCTKAQCNPETGACEAVTSDTFCDDDDVCTLDACDAETGTCSYTAVEACGATHPCQPASTPASDDAAINACVCDIAPACCEAEWQPYCIEIGQDQCGLACDCKDLDPATLTCEADTDCAFCDDGDLCNGTWSCQDGVCLTVDPVVCDTSSDAGCIATVCTPESGACEAMMDASVCDDGDPCSDDVCDEATGTCASTPNDACGANNPCVSAPFPTSNDPEITECVCELDAYCCETAWDTQCVGGAEANCGAVCSCDDPSSPVACDEEADCLGCDDGDLCNGTWGCVDNICMALNDAVVCDPSLDDGCLKNSCVSPGGACELLPQSESCDDGDPCTADLCDEAGVCSNTEIAGCTLNHPCSISAFPESSDEAITACVCDLDAWCCETNWDSLCVDQAQNDCGAVCDCADPGADLGCETDADCGWCSTDLCAAPWTCEDGHCAAGDAVVCDTAGDTECLSNQCDATTGACALSEVSGACDDEDPCTADSCNESGVCEHEVLTGCEGEPPFECLGASEPSAEGCGIVESYEGCCDPWGRVTWCQDGSTYCIQCQENPLCGWDTGGGYYNCGTAGEEEPSGESPMMCPAFAP